MKVIKLENGVQSEVTYPKKDLSEIKDLDEGIIFYNIIKGDSESYDSNQYSASWVDTLVDEADETYPHMYVCNRTFTLTEKSEDTVISNLNASLGAHLDDNYPEYKRQADSDILLYYSPTDDEETYILEKKQWLYDCRKERDSRETEYLTNGTFPSFTWDEMPTNTEE
jgi:hypothetical protein